MDLNNKKIEELNQMIKEATDTLNDIAQKINKSLSIKLSIEFIYTSSVMAAWLEDLIDLSNISLIDLIDKKNLDILERYIKDNVEQNENYNIALKCLIDMKEILRKINSINRSLQKENHIEIPKRILYDKYLCDFISQIFGYDSFLYLYNWHDDESKEDYINKELRIINSAQSIKLNQNIYNYLVIYANDYLKDSSDIVNIESYISNI